MFRLELRFEQLTHSDGMQAGAVCSQLVIRWTAWKRRMEGYLAMI